VILGAWCSFTIQLEEAIVRICICDTVTAYGAELSFLFHQLIVPDSLDWSLPHVLDAAHNPHVSAVCVVVR